MNKGLINPTELVASLINLKDNLVLVEPTEEEIAKEEEANEIRIEG